jgi:drug/metabolite transporter (DMT)-like permease
MDWILLIVPGTIWGASFLFIAEGLEAMGPNGVTFTRILVGFLTIALFPGSRRPVSREDWPGTALVGVLWMAFPLSLFPFAEQRVSSALTGMLNGAVPLFTAIVAAGMARRWPSRSIAVGLAVGLAGGVLMALPTVGQGRSTALGMLLILAALVSYGFAINVARPVQQRQGALPVIWRAQAVALVLTAPLGLPEVLAARWSPGPLLSLLALGALGTGMAYVLTVLAAGRVGATKALGHGLPHTASGAAARGAGAGRACGGAVGARWCRVPGGRMADAAGAARARGARRSHRRFPQRLQQPHHFPGIPLTACGNGRSWLRGRALPWRTATAPPGAGLGSLGRPVGQWSRPHQRLGNLGDGWKLGPLHQLPLVSGPGLRLGRIGVLHGPHQLSERLETHAPAIDHEGVGLGELVVPPQVRDEGVGTGAGPHVRYQKQDEPHTFTDRLGAGASPPVAWHDEADAHPASLGVAPDNPFDRDVRDGLLLLHLTDPLPR